MVEPGSHLEIIHNLRAELRGIEHEHDVAREACENLTAMRDAAVRERDAAVALLRRYMHLDNYPSTSDEMLELLAQVQIEAAAFLSRHDAKAGAR